LKRKQVLNSSGWKWVFRSSCSSIGIEAEIAALKQGVASIYPDISGIEPLKKETSRFIKTLP